MHWEIPGAVLEASPAVVATPPGSVDTVSLSIGLLEKSAGGAALATATALLALGGTVVVWYRRTQANGTGQTVPSNAPASTDDTPPETPTGGDAGAETRGSGGRDRPAQAVEETDNRGPAASVGPPGEELPGGAAEQRAVTTGRVVADPKRPALDEDEAQVLAMLDNNNGQMRQSAVVERTDWSKSKVSLVLSEMSDRGLVTKLPVGRQNVIFCKGEEPGIVLTDDDADQN